MSEIFGSNRERFRAIRKKTTKNLTLEGFLESRKIQNPKSLKQFNSVINELGVLLGTKFELSVMEYVEELLIASKSDDITDDVRDIKQSFWEFLSTVGRACSVCGTDGRRFIHRRYGYDVFAKCYHCDGTKKKLRAASYGTKVNYLSRLDTFFRYFGIYNKIDERNIKVVKGRKPKGMRKSLSKKLLIEIINHTNKFERKQFWQFLAMSGVRDSEGLKLKKRDFVFVNGNGDVLNSEYGHDRIRVRIRAETGNKMRVERNTFVHKELEGYVIGRLHSINNDDYVFHDKTLSAATSDEVSAFLYTRAKMIEEGFVEMTEMKPENTQHAITLHTLRSFFISKANRIDDSSFGDAIAGHEDSMKAVYDRFSPKELLDMWKKAEPLLSLKNDNEDLTEELEKKCEVLTDQLSTLKEEYDDKIKKALKEQQVSFTNEIQSREMRLYEKFFETINDKDG